MKDYILCGLVVVLLILFVVSKYMYLPVAFFVVGGSSMKPTLNMGDIIIGLRESFSEGDIVVWCTTSFSCVAHRVISVNENYVVTKGDNNPLHDLPIPKSFVKYKVIGSIPLTVWFPLLILFSLLYLSLIHI